MAYVDEKTGKLVYKEITKAEVVQANYLASMKDDSKVDDTINFYTGLMPWNWGTIDASHTEIGFWVDGEDGKPELWFCSSTSRNELGAGKENGTRWIKGSELLRHPERWHLQVKTITEYSGAGMIDWKVSRANNLMGLRYDFRGVLLDFTVPWRVFRKKRLHNVLVSVSKQLKKIYCSKFVHAVDTGWLIVFSPKRRYKWAGKNGYVSVECGTEVWLRSNGVIE